MEVGAVPTLLRLISLEVEDFQEGGSSAGFDQVRLLVTLDGYPTRRLPADFMAGPSAPAQRTLVEFTEADNLDDEGHPFVFWSFADVVCIEIDSGGGSVLADTDTDEWIQTVRLDHRDIAEVKIGKTDELTYLLPGRTDCHYTLKFSLTGQSVSEDPQFRRKLEGGRFRGEFLDDSDTIGNLAEDKGNAKWICAVDGGGLRGIFPLRVLEQLERYYRRPAFEIFDMFAGTSTGSMISAALARGLSVDQVISAYADASIRRVLFRSNAKGQHQAFRYLDFNRADEAGEVRSNLNQALSPAYVEDLAESKKGDVTRLLNKVAETLMTPRYRKSGMKEVLWQLLSTPDHGDLKPLRLRDCGKGGVTKDVLLIAWDLHRNESTLMSAFHVPREVPDTGPVVASLTPGGRDLPKPDTHPTKTTDVVFGQYKDILLKDAVEVSSSAPVYFAPRARFTDGGIGPYNNPSFIAAFQALHCTDVDPAEDLPQLPAKYTAYRESGGSKSGTVVWSFGTAYHDASPQQEAGTADVVGGSLSLNDRTDTGLYWLERVLDSLMFGASEEQAFLCREVLRGEIKYVRVNLGVSPSALDELNMPGDHEQTLSAIKLDAVDPTDFEAMDRVAQRFALRAREEHFGFDEGGFELPRRALDDAARRAYTTFVETELAAYE